MQLKALTRMGLVLLAVLTAAQTLAAEKDYETARKLRESGDILPLEIILLRLKKNHPGKVLEVEMETRHGRLLYEIELLDDKGKVWEFKIDPRTGDIVKQETEN